MSSAYAELILSVLISSTLLYNILQFDVDYEHSRQVEKERFEIEGFTFDFMKGFFFLTWPPS